VFDCQRLIPYDYFGQQARFQVRLLLALLKFKLLLKTLAPENNLVYQRNYKEVQNLYPNA
jgi:hypothetical protein